MMFAWNVHAAEYMVLFFGGGPLMTLRVDPESN